MQSEATTQLPGREFQDVRVRHEVLWEDASRGHADRGAIGASDPVLTDLIVTRVVELAKEGVYDIEGLSSRTLSSLKLAEQARPDRENARARCALLARWGSRHPIGGRYSGAIADQRKDIVPSGPVRPGLSCATNTNMAVSLLGRWLLNPAWLA